MIEPWLFAVLGKVATDVQLLLHVALSLYVNIATISQVVPQPVLFRLEGTLQVVISNSGDDFVFTIDGIDPNDADTANNSSSKSLLGGVQGLWSKGWSKLLSRCWL